MTLPYPVVWSQGMFLQPHHFQQQTHHLEHLVDARVRAAGADAWGFSQLSLDESQLALGRVAIARAAGVLPDGTPFSVPDVDAAPPALEVPAEMSGEAVVLALLRSRGGITEVEFDAEAAQAAGGAPTRYRVDDVPLRDRVHAADDPEPIQLGVPLLRLLRARDAGSEHAAMAVARVAERRADAQVVLERGHIAPQTRIDASAQLSASTQLLHGLAQQRAQLLVRQLAQLGHGMSELEDFLMLLVLNRAEPVLRQHVANAAAVHPRELHLALLRLAGELATFEPATRRPPEFPVYRHDDLQGTFAPLLRALHEMLLSHRERHAVQIDLTPHSHGVHSAVVADAQLLRSAGFMLAVRAQLPADVLRQRFLAQTKLGPIDRLKDLVNRHLPGVAMRSLAVAPRQLPYHAGSHYFELERQGELWKLIEQQGSLAMHVAGDFPGLELELWAVRQI